jgi:hypothetical protein
MSARTKTATKTASTPENGTTAKTRTRRTPEQMVADLQAEIERVKARAAAKDAKANPEGRAFIAAAKALDKAIELCAGDMKHALESARAILAEQMVAMGVRAPEPRNGRPRRTQGA